MHIALTADPELPVPPRLYGGIERIIDMLVRGLVARGHDVTLFAHRDSRTAGHLVPWPGKSSVSKTDTVRNAATLAHHVMTGRFDIFHSFSRVIYMAPILPIPLPKLMTYQREISPRSIRLGHSLSRGRLQFTAISRHMMRGVGETGTWHMVPNGVPLELYSFVPQVPADAPLVFLGRIEEIKGPHLAIEIARRTGSKLMIAGNVPAEHLGWFDAHIAPHLDGRQICYVGPVDDAAKNDLLGAARALLMPILWEEPFGIVMAEAMACGTPVLGLARGAVPEVVEHGVTGFVADDIDELCMAVERIDSIDRGACRRRVEEHYSDTAVVAQYLAVYERMTRGA